MTLRVTPSLIVAQTFRAAQLHGSRVALYNAQMTSGLKLTKPSDDPAATRSLLGVRSALNRMETELGNITATRQRLQVANTALLESKEIMVKVKDLMLQARQTTEDTDRQALAEELTSLRHRLIGLANTRHNGEYLFGGAANNAAPFEVADGGRVTYVGADARGSTEIRATTRMDVLYSGAEIFQPRERQATTFRGLTGAAPGAGVDSAAGYGELQVIHTSTTYAGGSGITAGTGSAAGDTIIGPAGAHTLTIDDVAGTVALNGGNPVPYTAADTNLRVLGPDNEVVYVNTTAITAGFVGTVSITSNGALSIDGGATQLPIDFSANQQVVNGGTGAVTHVDSSGIRSTGSEYVDYVGTADVFELLDRFGANLVDHARAGTADWHSELSRHMEDLERLQGHVLDIIGEQATSLENLDSLQTRIGDLQVEQELMKSELQDADMAAAVLKWKNEQTMLEYTLAGTVRLFDTTLVDFL